MLALYYIYYTYAYKRHLPSICPVFEIIILYYYWKWPARSRVNLLKYNNVWLEVKKLKHFILNVMLSSPVNEMNNTLTAINGTTCITKTKTEMLSFWQNFNHWLHQKLARWQLPVQPVIKIPSKWRQLCFIEGYSIKLCWCGYYGSAGVVYGSIKQSYSILFWYGVVITWNCKVVCDYWSMN